MLRIERQHRQTHILTALWETWAKQCNLPCPVNAWQAMTVTLSYAAQDVPTNVLHQRGFASIGCEPCTIPVLPHQHEREGRWAWEVSTHGHTPLFYYGNHNMLCATRDPTSTSDVLHLLHSCDKGADRGSCAGHLPKIGRVDVHLTTLMLWLGTSAGCYSKGVWPALWQPQGGRPRQWRDRGAAGPVGWLSTCAGKLAPSAAKFPPKNLHACLALASCLALSSSAENKGLMHFSMQPYSIASQKEAAPGMHLRYLSSMARNAGLEPGSDGGNEAGQEGQRYAGGHVCSLVPIFPGSAPLSVTALADASLSIAAALTAMHLTSWLAIRLRSI